MEGNLSPSPSSGSGSPSLSFGSGFSSLSSGAGFPSLSSGSASPSPSSAQRRRLPSTNATNWWYRGTRPPIKYASGIPHIVPQPDSTHLWPTMPRISSHSDFHAPLQPEPLDTPPSHFTQSAAGTPQPRSYHEGTVFSDEQQAKRQPGGETAADIKTSQRTGPRGKSVNVDELFPAREMSGRPHSYQEYTVLSGDQWRGRPYSHHEGNTPADYPGLKPLVNTQKWYQTRKGKQCIIGFGVVALLIIVILAELIGYFCFHKKVCDPLNWFGGKVSTVATVPPEPRSTNLSSTVISTKKDATVPPIQVTVSRCEDDTCGANQQCNETPLGPSCNCLPGYDGPKCADDINECEQATDECSVDETCQNTDGGYSCRPQQGKTRAPAQKPKKGVGVIIIITLFASSAIVIVLMTVYLVSKRTKQTQRRLA